MGKVIQLVHHLEGPAVRELPEQSRDAVKNAPMVRHADEEDAAGAKQLSRQLQSIHWIRQVLQKIPHGDDVEGGLFQSRAVEGRVLNDEAEVVPGDP
jgi:hypothetical protein